jgi:hypothetical protein
MQNVYSSKKQNPSASGQEELVASEPTPTSQRDLTVSEFRRLMELELEQFAEERKVNARRGASEWFNMFNFWRTTR